MEQDKECISVEQAALSHAEKATPNHIAFNRTAKTIDNMAFQAGAQWQKEQLNKLLHLINQAINELELCGAIHLANLIEKEVNKL